MSLKLKEGRKLDGRKKINAKLIYIYLFIYLFYIYVYICDNNNIKTRLFDIAKQQELKTSIKIVR